MEIVIRAPLIKGRDDAYLQVVPRLNVVLMGSL